MLQKIKNAGEFSISLAGGTGLSLAANEAGKRWLGREVLQLVGGAQLFLSVTILATVTSVVMKVLYRREGTVSIFRGLNQDRLFGKFLNHRVTQVVIEAIVAVGLGFASVALLSFPHGRVFQYAIEGGTLGISYWVAKRIVELVIPLIVQIGRATISLLFPKEIVPQSMVGREHLNRLREKRWDLGLLLRQTKEREPDRDYSNLQKILSDQTMVDDIWKENLEEARYQEIHQALQKVERALSNEESETEVTTEVTEVIESVRRTSAPLSDLRRGRAPRRKSRPPSRAGRMRRASR